ncbi:hypothetical protein LVD17_03750 [Fulvivirga ulvae]|uniref:DUF6607 family protein n=1 Tax=Fulvivirga ulvae TaxID=2904245 RepID=UPI001F375381|nr:DUF6607 family protein [Fulvivirga ulvae]UII32942.1 hypothetical protein LVD17_03750 [Fulvivirga ulvae]
MRKLLILSMVFIVANTYAQKKKKQQDIEAIKSMCGCYEVTFNFAETFASEKDYEFHDNYKTGGLEWVTAAEESNDKIVLQHLLIVGDTMIIKHWRQDWLYENTELYTYYKDKTWKPVTLPKEQVKGQWTQKVYQVDDEPRYEGSATWIHTDGRHYWENTADAPLPRREHTKRSDYNVMKRRNRHELTAEGWIHEQDNDKVIRESDKDVILAQEKGLNTYKKVSDEQCQVAKKWWKENEQYWADVRAVWDELFNTRKELSFKSKVEDKLLFQRLFSLGDELSSKEYNSENARQLIRKAIQPYLISDIELASK